MNTRFAPDPDRPSCPRCGKKVNLTASNGNGDVARPFAVTVACPYTVPRAQGGTEGCRQPTAVVLDRYGSRYLFAPTFDALNKLLEVELKSAAA
jgi:hypothetical protein